jgi:hypothetical protein
MFDHTERVLLECPVEDNAIYVLDSGEDRLLRMTKRELRESGEEGHPHRRLVPTAQGRARDRVTPP